MSAEPSRTVESRPWASWRTRYLIALAAVAGGVVLRMPFIGVLGSAVPFITFFPAVIATSAFAGLGPALFCTALSALTAVYLYVQPPYRLALTTPADVASVALFVFVCGAIAAMQEMLSRARRAAIEAAQRAHKQGVLNQLTLASITDGVVSTGISGSIEFMNHVAERLTGWTLAEAKGRPARDILPLVDGNGEPVVRHPIDRVLSTGEPIARTSELDRALIAKDGRRIAIEKSAAPIRDGEGRVIGSVLVLSDVSERRAAQRSIEESERRLRTTLESITDAFVSIDRDWRFTYVNGAAERILERPARDLVGHDHWEQFPQALGTVIEKEYRRAATSRQSAHFEYLRPSRNAWLEFNVYPAAEGGLSIYFRDITDRKTSEERLRLAKTDAEQARDLLRVTLASIGDCVIATDAEQRVTFVNGAAASLFGQPAGDLVGRAMPDIFSLFDERTGSALASPVEQALNTGRVAELSNHAVLRTADARQIPVEDSAAPIRDETGKVAGAVLVFRDITEKRRAAEALERSEERLRLANNAGQIGVWDWDLANDRIEWTEAVYGIHGVPIDTPVGELRDYARLIHPDDRERVQRAITAAVEHDAPYSIEFRIIRADGALRWVATTGTVFRSEDGRAVRMLGSTKDITEARQVQDALRQSEERLKLALDAAKMGTWDWDLKTNAVVWSEHHYRAYGLEPVSETPSYDLWRQSVHAQDLPRLELQIQQAMRDCGEYRAEYRVIWPDGSTHWLEGRGRVFCDDQKQPARMTGVVVDITERKRVEESLLGANEELQHFAYAASHDLKEPLRTITSFSQLLVREFESKPQAAAHVEYIVEAVRRMRSLIDGMLDLTQAGGVETVPHRRVSARDVIESTLVSLNASIDETGAEVVFDDMPDLVGDPAQLNQVFQNLISNAIKYRRPDVKPVIRISSEVSNGECRFTVRDNGIGFPDQYAERIFAPFRRLHGREIPGAGIGLALCRRIIARHHGRIWADGGNGAGATFYFTLPAAAQTDVEQTSATV